MYHGETMVVVSRYAQIRGAAYSLKFQPGWCPKYRRPVLVGPVEKRPRKLLEQKALEL
jgi:putative transposase